MDQHPFTKWKENRLRRILNDARITIDYNRRKDVEYLREMVSNNFFSDQQVGYNAEESSLDIRTIHERYVNNANQLLNLTHSLIHTLTTLNHELTQISESTHLMDDLRSDGIHTLQNLLKELQQHDCSIMLIGDTGSGKSTMINAIVQQAVVPTGIIKTTGAIIEISYNEDARFSIVVSDVDPLLVEQQVQFNRFPDRPSDAIASFIGNDVRGWSFVRARLEYPLPLLKSGIIIKDTPGLNDTDQLTAAVMQDMMACQAFICVLNRGFTNQVRQILLRLIGIGRDPDSIFFVITHMDDYSIEENMKALKRVRSDLYEIDSRFNNTECVLFNPRCAFDIFTKYGLYTKDYVEFLLCFTPFLSRILLFKYDLITAQLGNIVNQLQASIKIIKYGTDSIIKTCQKQNMASEERKRNYKNSTERMKKKVLQLLDSRFLEGSKTILDHLQSAEFNMRFEQAITTIPFLKNVEKDLTWTELSSQETIKKELESRKLYLQREFQQCTQNILVPLLNELTLSLIQNLGQMVSEDFCLMNNENASFLQKLKDSSYQTILQCYRHILKQMLLGIKFQSTSFTKLFISYYSIGASEIASSISDVLLQRNVKALENEEYWNKVRQKLSEKFRHALFKLGNGKEIDAEKRYYSPSFLLQSNEEILKLIEQSYIGTQEEMTVNLTREHDATTLLNLCSHYIDDIIPRFRAAINKIHMTRLNRWSLSTDMIFATDDRDSLPNDDNFHIVPAIFKRTSGCTPVPVYVRRLSGDFCALHVSKQTFSICEPMHDNILHCYGAYYQNGNVFVVTERWRCSLRTALTDSQNFSLKQRLQLAIELTEICIQYRLSISIDHLSLDTLVISQDHHIKVNLITYRPSINMSHEHDHYEQEREIQMIRGLGMIFKDLFTLNQDVSQLPRSLYLFVEQCCVKLGVNDNSSPTMDYILGTLKIEQIKLQLQHLPRSDSLKVSRKRYGLLAIDGGGSRGIIPAKILDAIQLATNKSLWEIFQFGAGVSTGGLLVLSTLVRQTPPCELVPMYKTFCSKIFLPRFLPTQNYPAKYLEQQLKQHFGDIRMTRHNSEAPRVFVVTKQNYDPHPYLLRNYDVPNDSIMFKGESGWLCSDAARATTAAPTYFAPLVRDGIQYTDGAMGFNNPVLLLFKEFLLFDSISNDTDRDEEGRILPIEYIVSIGTGEMDGLAASSRPKKGLKGMFKTVQLAIELITDYENAHYQMQMLAKAHGNIPYFRFNPKLPERLPLDISTEKDLDNLVKLTEDYLKNTVPEQIQKLAELINGT